MMGGLPRLPRDQVLRLLPLEEQLDSKECLVFALYLLGGRATECEAHLAMYLLHRLGICRLHGDWRYKPCAWAWAEDAGGSGELPRPVFKGQD